MKYEAILHIPMSQYAFGIDENHIVFRLRSGTGDIKRCTLIYGDRACRKTPVEYSCLDMSIIRTDSYFDWWEITLETRYKRVCYGFKMEDFSGNSTYYYGDLFNDSLTDDRSLYFQLPYNHRADRADVPRWMKNAIVYNVFPDSFATRKGEISEKPTEKHWQGETVRGKLGGTINGITENLQYIHDLGFNCIYINPIFVAGEYHKYDVIEYYHIDPAFGTNDDFKRLVISAHDLDMRVIIDGVFNHIGWKSEQFRDVIAKGKSSPYWSWFFHLEEPVVIPENPEDYPNYECFGYERMMPKLATDNPAVQEYFCNVGKYWVREFDIDGWRLDVASEVNDGFWRAFRRAVKSVKPDCALIGEVWESAGHWLDCDMFDSTMNYDFRRHCACFFAYQSITAKQFDSSVTNMLTRYRAQIVSAQMNLLDSHDVSRFLSLCSDDVGKMKLAILFQMTFPGMPCVFYGDEKEITGILEEEYRTPMPWDSHDCELEHFYKKAISLRKQHNALIDGAFITVAADGMLYHYQRKNDSEIVGIIMNCSETSASIGASENILWQENCSCGIIDAYGFMVYIQ